MHDGATHRAATDPQTSDLRPFNFLTYYSPNPVVKLPLIGSE